MFVPYDDPAVVVDDVPSLRTVLDNNGGCLEPVLEVVQRHGYVLCVVLVENPDLSQHRRLR